MNKQEQIEYFRTKVVKKYVDEVMENLNLNLNLNLKEEEKQNVKKAN